MKKLIIAVMCLSLVLVGGNVFAQSAAVVKDVGASVEQTDNSVSNVYDRKFVNPGVTPLPQTNNFFTTPTPDSSFRSAKELVEDFGNGTVASFTEGALESMAKGGDVDANLQVVRGQDQILRFYTKEYEGVKWLWVAIQPVDGMKKTAYIDGEADDADTNSYQVIGKAGLKALKDGNNVMVITKEGAHRAVESSGWGIGFYTVGGTISESGRGSGALGGGTGYAKNAAATEDRPWIQGVAGVVDIENPTTAKDAREAAE